jgi:hypothetical protein
LPPRYQKQLDEFKASRGYKPLSIATDTAAAAAAVTDMGNERHQGLENPREKARRSNGVSKSKNSSSNNTLPQDPVPSIEEQREMRKKREEQTQQQQQQQQKKTVGGDASDFHFTKVESNIQSVFEPYRDSQEQPQQDRKLYSPPRASPVSAEDLKKNNALRQKMKSPLDPDHSEPRKNPQFDDDGRDRGDNEEGEGGNHFMLSNKQEDEEGVEGGEPRKRARRMSLSMMEIKKAERDLRKIAKKNDVKALEDCWNEIKTKFEGKVNIDTINLVMFLFDEMKMREEGQKTLQYARDHKIALNSATYSIAIRLANDPAEADALLQEAKEKDLVSLRTFSPLLVKHAKVHNVERTFDLFHQIEEHKLDPDDIVFQALFRSLQGSKDASERIQMAFQYLRKHRHSISKEVAEEITRLCTSEDNTWDVQTTTVHKRSGEDSFLFPLF